MSHPVFLSVVLTGRNDDHGAGFARRFLRALRFNHQQFIDHAIDHEFVVVEWGPCADRPWLLDVVAGEYPAVLPHCRWWLVDPLYTSACTLNPKMLYPEFHAKNVGLRRAAGQFVLSSNCDVYFGRGVLERVARTYRNPSSWGLGLAPERQLRPGVCWLDFDWQAVPALAPISRLGAEVW